MTDDQTIHVDAQERARRRSARRRTLDMIENVIESHGVERCVTDAVAQWLAGREIETVDDIETADPAARALIDLVVANVRRCHYDTKNPRTKARVWKRLGLSDSHPPRPRHDELTR